MNILYLILDLWCKWSGNFIVQLIIFEQKMILNFIINEIVGNYEIHILQEKIFYVEIFYDSKIQHKFYLIRVINVSFFHFTIVHWFAIF